MQRETANSLNLKHSNPKRTKRLLPFSVFLALLFAGCSESKGGVADAELENDKGAVDTLSDAAVPELLVALPAESEQDATAEQLQLLDKIKKRETTRAVFLTRVDVNAFKESNISISLPNAQKLHLSRKGFQARDQNNFTWSGRTPGALASNIFVVRDGHVTGKILGENHEVYSLESMGDGMHALVQIDNSKLPPSGPPVSVNMPGMQQGLPLAPAARLNALQSPTPIEIDVFVGFTAAAREDVFNLQSNIDLLVEETNETYELSKVNIRLNLVDLFQVDFGESGNTYDGILWEFASSETVRKRRNEVGADVGVIIAGSGLTDKNQWCGRAYVNPPEDLAFAVVSHQCFYNYIFAHEIGHVQGANHNEQQDINPFFPYGHGYLHPSSIPEQNFRTIMSYNNIFLCPNGWCPVIPYWSNPEVSYNGISTGTADINNNARVLNETATRVAAFRDKPTTPECTLSALSLSIPFEGGFRSVVANCAGFPTNYIWTVNGELQPQTGNTVDYNFPPNFTQTPRTFIVSVVAVNSAGAGKPAELTLTQEHGSGAPVCSLTPQVVTIPSGGGTYSVAANCTRSPTSYRWTVNGQVQSASGNTLNYYFPANTTSAERSFIVALAATNSAGTGSMELTLRQPPGTPPPPPPAPVLSGHSFPASPVPTSGATFRVTSNQSGTAYWRILKLEQGGTQICPAAGNIWWMYSNEGHMTANSPFGGSLNWLDSWERALEAGTHYLFCFYTYGTQSASDVWQHAFSTAAAPPPPPPPPPPPNYCQDATPLYVSRYTAPNHHNSYMSTDINLHYSALSQGYVSAGIVARLPRTKLHATSSHLFKQFFNLDLLNHYYGWRVGDIAYVLSDGWYFERDEGYIYDMQLSGTVPLYVLWRNWNGDRDLEHRYTTSDSERDAWVRQGYNLDSVMGFVCP
jgi:hypothetical protein